VVKGLTVESRHRTYGFGWEAVSAIGRGLNLVEPRRIDVLYHFSSLSE